MGVLPRIEAHATGTDTADHLPRGRRGPPTIDYAKLIAAMSDRHVEIMRDDLCEIYYDAGRDDVEYLFGDQITAISADGEVTFAHAAPTQVRRRGRRRRTALGCAPPDLRRRRRTHPLPRRLSCRGFGAEIACLDGEMVVSPRRRTDSPWIYTADHLDDARAVFMFRQQDNCDYDHRDTARQKELLRAAFAGMAAGGRQLARRDRSHARRSTSTPSPNCR